MLRSKLRRKKKQERTMIRRARRSDADAIERMWFDLLTMQGELNSHYAPSEDARSRWKNDFPSWLDRLSRRILVAEIDGAIRGFISAEQWAPPPIFDDEPGIYINELFVEESHRRRGLGTLLVEGVRDWAEEIGVYQLRAGVLVANEDGAAFWTKIGGNAVSQTFAVSIDHGSEEDEKEKKRSIGFRL